MTETRIYADLVASIDATLAVASATVPLMSDDQFSLEHEAVHSIDNTLAVETIAAIFEAEFWRRWPEGRDDV